MSREDLTMTAPAVTKDDLARLAAAYPDVFTRTLRQRLMPWLIALGIFAYAGLSFWHFDLGSLFRGGHWERAGIELLQWVSYETRPTIDIKGDRLETSFHHFDVLGYAPKPDWIRTTGTGKTQVQWSGDAYRMTLTPSDAEIVNGADRLHFRNSPTGWVLDGPAPVSVKLQEGGARISFGLVGNVELDKTSVTIRKRFAGWANFFFDPDSKLWGKSWPELAVLMTSGPRLDPARSNLSLALDNFSNNANWQHGDVWIKLLQTIVMAFVGTLFGAILAFPLAFLAAANITRVTAFNQLAKRFFDVLRCVGLLVWALFFTRGFGPGPLSGISAIFVSEVGLLGKTYTEALENIDNKQREGISSVGATATQVQRYGVLPQVLPVFTSQALYQWESNTRSATVIGAMGAGGIGLKLIESMRTGSNWANVCYMVILILIVVYVFDGISTWLRRRLIVGA
jgi:phosphonate transport system permease protein